MVHLFDFGALKDEREVGAVDEGDVVGHLVVAVAQLLLVDNDDALLEVREHLLVVADEERLGHEGQLFRVLRRQFQRRRDAVRDDVVHVGGAAGARIAEPHHLDRRRPQGKDFVARPFRVAVHVDQYVDAVRVDPIGRLAVARHLPHHKSPYEAVLFLRTPGPTCEKHFSFILGFLSTFEKQTTGLWRGRQATRITRHQHEIDPFQTYG